MKYFLQFFLLILSLPGADRFHVLLNKYCVECHGGRKTKGDVDFKKYDGLEHIYKNFETWENAVQQIEEGDMPPDDEPQMSKLDKEFFLTTLKSVFTKMKTVDFGDPGPTPLRRLTRIEYNNSIRDIFGTDLQLGKEFPSEGGGGEGFDNNAEVLNFSPIMFEKYMTEAEELSHHLIFNYTMGFEIQAEEIPLRNTPQQQTYLKRMEDEFKSLALPKKLKVEDLLVEFMLIAHEYTLTEEQTPKSLKMFSEWKKVNATLLRHLVDYLKDRKSKNNVERYYLQEWYKLKRNDPTEIIVQAAKEFKSGYEKGRFVNERGTDEFRKPYRELFIRIKKVFSINDKEFLEILSAKDRVKVLNIRLEKGLLENGASQNKQRLLKEHIKLLLTKAWRKPPSSRELDRMINLFNKINSVKGEQAAARVVIVRTFCSPFFIYRVEKQLTSTKPYRISDRELAVRLAYFLWSSTPDAELMDLAAKQLLSKKDILNQQVDRLLKDPRAGSLGIDFAAQWLKFRDVLGAVEVDQKKFPEFNEKLAQDMYQECVSSFNDIVKSNSSVLNLIDSDYVFLNENLAKVYDIKNVKGDHFRKVVLRDRFRGGLITSPAIMAMTSYPLRTSPVLRGNYIISSFLGTPTPPPPKDVGQLAEDDNVSDGLSVKQRLQAHRAKPECAGCHSRMDPIGFPLEVFDPIGRKRERIAGKLIDATGELKGGRKIIGPVGLKKYLLEKQDLFLENMATKLLGYSLGRSVQFFDKYMINQTLNACKDNDYKFSAMIKSIVNSKTFQYRRGSKQ